MFISILPPTPPRAISTANVFQKISEVSWIILENMGGKFFPRNILVLENLGEYGKKVVSKKILEKMEKNLFPRKISW